MKRTGILCCWMLAMAAPLTGQTGAGPGTIVATGIGEVSLRPDRVSISMAIRTISAGPDEAQSQNEMTAEAVFAALSAMDIDPDSIRLTDLRIGLHREYGPDGRRDAGFEATRRLRVGTEDLGMVGSIVEVATEAGATSVDRVAYWSSGIDEARLEALTDAVQAARRDAEVMAAASGGRLGGLRLLTTNPATSTPMRVRGARIIRGGFSTGTAESTPDAADLTITMLVEGHWLFESGD